MSGTCGARKSPALGSGQVSLGVFLECRESRGLLEPQLYGDQPAAQRRPRGILSSSKTYFLATCHETGLFFFFLFSPSQLQRPVASVTHCSPCCFRLVNCKGQCLTHFLLLSPSEPLRPVSHTALLLVFTQWTAKGQCQTHSSCCFRPVNCKGQGHTLLFLLFSSSELQRPVSHTALLVAFVQWTAMVSVTHCTSCCFRPVNCNGQCTHSLLVALVQWTANGQCHAQLFFLFSSSELQKASVTHRVLVALA